VLRVRKDAISKQMAFYAALREAIISGAIGPNRRIPSTREFARTYHIARGTAMLVYESLEAEGYLVSRRGVGTLTAASLPDDRLVRRTAGFRSKLQHPDSAEATRALGQALSRLGRQFAAAPLPTDANARRRIPFLPFSPALNEFPISLWARLTAKHARLVKPELLGDGCAAGWPRLRAAIAEYLGSTRGVDCAPEQVILTSSTQHSLLLAAQLLTDPGDQALIEDPGYPGALAALRIAGLAIVPVPVDSQGMQIVVVGERLGVRPQFAYVTPAHQCPTGVAMSVGRRQALLDWAVRHEAWIFEDDYDSEFRYLRPPSPSLYAMDRSGRVLHAGCFSKTLFPALRISYLVVPASLVDAFAHAQALYGRYPAILPQLVLCDFIESGHFVRHIRRMVECYRERRAALVNALDEQFGSSIEITPEPVGLELTVWWRGGKDAQTIATAAGVQDIHVEPTSRFQIRNPVSPGAVLGFAAFDASTLRCAVGRLASAVDAYDRRMLGGAVRSGLSGPTRRISNGILHSGRRVL